METFLGHGSCQNGNPIPPMRKARPFRVGHSSLAGLPDQPAHRRHRRRRRITGQFDATATARPTVEETTIDGQLVQGPRLALRQTDTNGPPAAAYAVRQRRFRACQRTVSAQPVL